MMGIDLLDLAFRLERTFGVKIGPNDIAQMCGKNDPPDIKVGQLFDFVRTASGSSSALLDTELDADAVWPLFQRDICDALGIEPEDVTKDKGIIQDLGAT